MSEEKRKDLKIFALWVDEKGNSTLYDSDKT